MRRNPSVPWDLEEVGHLGAKNGPRGAVVVFGGQAGSEGKGAIVGYLAMRHMFTAAVCSFGPNAGHTWTGIEGQQVVTHQIPMSVVAPHVGLLCISAGAALNVHGLLEEIETLEALGIDVKTRLRIDPCAVVIDQAHIEREKVELAYIASTLQGGGAARAARVMRSPDLRFARDVSDLQRYLADVPGLLNDEINRGGAVLVEGAQGIDLDPMHGYRWPYMTSHGCSPAQLLHDAGIAPQMITRSIMVIRTFPIRVGNTDAGTSGPLGSEITFDRIAAEAGLPTVPQEITTTTKRPRRVFKLDLDRLARVSDITRPTDIAITHMDYVDATVRGWSNVDGTIPPWPSEVSKKIFDIERACKRPTARPRASLVKTGPGYFDIVDKVRGW